MLFSQPAAPLGLISKIKTRGSHLVFDMRAQVRVRARRLAPACATLTARLFRPERIVARHGLSPFLGARVGLLCLEVEVALAMSARPALDHTLDTIRDSRQEASACATSTRLDSTNHRRGHSTVRPLNYLEPTTILPHEDSVCANERCASSGRRATHGISVQPDFVTGHRVVCSVSIRVSPMSPPVSRCCMGIVHPANASLSRTCRWGARVARGRETRDGGG
jgi:hypothetical protein